MRISIALVLIWACWVESIPLLQRHHDEWHAWKTHHSREYFTAAEEEHRCKVWLDNKLYVDEHNSQADKLGYSLKMNAFGDKVRASWFEHACWGVADRRFLYKRYIDLRAASYSVCIKQVFILRVFVSCVVFTHRRIHCYSCFVRFHATIRYSFSFLSKAILYCLEQYALVCHMRSHHASMQFVLTCRPTLNGTM